MYVRKNLNHCKNETCGYCALHCPYCGEHALLLDREEMRRMRCSRCGQEESLPPPTFLELRPRQVLAISGRSIGHWRAQATHLSPHFQYRWRSTLQYLDPASSGAISYVDDLVCRYLHQMPLDDEIYLLRGRMARRVFQRLLEADPASAPVGRETEAYPDDWF
jgi:ferredoxin